MIDSVGEYKEHLFSRGYIFSSTKPTTPSWWDQSFILGYHLHHDPKLSKVQIEDERAILICLGIIFDTRLPLQDEKVTARFLHHALTISEERFLAELAYTGGRYVIIYQRQTEKSPLYLLTDATGMRTALHYNKEAQIVSSHLRLIQINAKEAIEPEIPIDRKFGFPGRKTALENVYFLTPNTKLNLCAHKVERYWPVKPLDLIPIEPASCEFNMLLSNSFSWVSRNYTPICSLTGGMDSRVTLAVAKHAAIYFTYYNPNENKGTEWDDRDFAQQLKEKFKINHNPLKLNIKLPKKYLNLLNINTFYSHKRSASFVFYQQYSQKNNIHIRSNLSEIGRMFYQNRKTKETGYNLLFDWWDRKHNFLSLDNKFAFKEFDEVTDFFNASVEKSSLFYWEHRMGTWHSQAIVQDDPIFETVSLYNCRRILEIMLSIPEKSQRNSEIMRRTIHAEWPELCDFPVNGKPFEPII